MKIVEIMPSLDVCGVTRFVVDLSNQLAQQHDVVLLVLYPCRQPEQYGISPRIRLVEMNKKKGADWKLCYRLKEQLNREKADIVHLHSASVLNYAAVAVFTQRQSRYFYTLHSEASFEIPGSFHRKLTEYTLLRPGLCRTVSSSDFAARSLPFKTPVVPLGRSLSEQQLCDANAAAKMQEIRSRNGATLLLCVGNLTPVKNQLMLCRAVRHLTEQGHNMELVLIGKAPDETYFRQLKPLLHHRRIHYIGPRKKVLAYMAQADFFCLSSLTESGPLVLLEAFFAGLIPICTPCGDVPNKVRSGENGLVAADFSRQAYEKVLLEALRLSPQRRQEIQAATRKSAQQYTMQRCAEHYLQLFNTP